MPIKLSPGQAAFVEYYLQSWHTPRSARHVSCAASTIKHSLHQITRHPAAVRLDQLIARLPGEDENDTRSHRLVQCLLVLNILPKISKNTIKHYKIL